MSPSVGLLNGFSVGMNENWQRWGDHESGRGWSRDVTSVLEGGGGDHEGGRGWSPDVTSVLERGGSLATRVSS